MTNTIPPWRHWYICTGSTYGTWLPGDPRGWRTKKHKQHVEGDYRNPPEDTEARRRLHRANQARLKHPPVYLDSTEARTLACDKIVMKLRDDQVECAAVAVCRAHYHVLLRAPDHQPRHWLGRAKMISTIAMAKAGVTPGRTWAGTGHAKPINDRQHYMRALSYVIQHGENEGAAVWVGEDDIADAL